MHGGVCIPDNGKDARASQIAPLGQEGLQVDPPLVIAKINQSQSPLPLSAPHLQPFKTASYAGYYFINKQVKSTTVSRFQK